MNTDTQPNEYEDKKNMYKEIQHGVNYTINFKTVSSICNSW